jgi:hypothetical protein
MTPRRILLLNALSTAACAAGMLLTRGSLYAQFGLEKPLLLDVLAVGLLAYAAALAVAARGDTIERSTLLAFTVADGLWVVASAAVLALFWGELTPLARVLVIAAALAVDVLAMLQYRAASTVKSRALGLA